MPGTPAPRVSNVPRRAPPPPPTLTSAVGTQLRTDLQCNDADRHDIVCGCAKRKNFGVPQHRGVQAQDHDGKSQSLHLIKMPETMARAGSGVREGVDGWVRLRPSECGCGCGCSCVGPRVGSCAVVRQDFPAAPIHSAPIRIPEPPDTQGARHRTYYTANPLFCAEYWRESVPRRDEVTSAPVSVRICGWLCTSWYFRVGLGGEDVSNPCHQAEKGTPVGPRLP